jgi:5-methylcytosine-specific restriction endonuclease McrA
MNKEYRVKNREKLLNQSMEWNKNNPEKIKKSLKKWRDKNKERILKDNNKFRKEHPEYRSEHYKKNKEKILKQNKKWREENPEHFKEIQKKWHKTEKGKAMIQRGNSKRQARIKKIINTLTSKEWLDILEKYNYRCFYCDAEFEIENMPTRDHIIPISKGGNNIKENVIPACKSCNSSKQDKDLIIFEMKIDRKHGQELKPTKVRLNFNKKEGDDK